MTSLQFKITSDDHFATTFELLVNFECDEGDWRIGAVVCLGAVLWIGKQGHEVEASDINGSQVLRDLVFNRELRKVSVEVNGKNVPLGVVLDEERQRDIDETRYGEPYRIEEQYESPVFGAA